MRLSSLAALAMLQLAFLTGCESDVSSKIALAGLSSKCRINSDCSADLACVFQRCHVQCKSSRDCERGSRCVAGEGALSVCLLADEATCSKTGVCPGRELCGVDGQCRDGCNSDSVCLDEQVCRAGTCADQDELDAQGKLTPSPDRPAQAPTPCQLDSDCPGSLVCASGLCVVECSSEATCAAGQSCVAGRCEKPAPQSTGCLRNSDCKESEQCLAGACQPIPTLPAPACSYNSECKKAGQRCVDGACQCECATDQNCDSGQVCQDGCQCVAGRVVPGNVTVTNTRELEAIGDVVEISGQLTLSIPGYAQYHLPHLRKVGALQASERNSVLVFDALEEVTGAFKCTQDCRAPRLSYAGSLNINSEIIRSLELPSLAATGDVYVGYSPYLTQVSMPLLTTAKNLRLEANQTLTSIDLPELATLDSISVAMAEQLRTLSLPAAKPSLSINVMGLATLETLSLPSADTLSSDISISNDPLLKSVDLSGLKQARTLTLSNLSVLSGLSLPNLTTLTGDFSYSSSSGPALLDLPNFKSGKVFVLDSLKGVTSLNAPALNDLSDLRITSTELTALDLPVKTITGGASVITNDKITRVSLPNVTALAPLYLIVDPSLTTISFPALKAVGDCAISSTGVTSLDSITPGLGGSLETATAIRMNSNDALLVCAIFALQTALTDKGWTGFIDQSGNLGCNCAGCACNGAVCQ